MADWKDQSRIEEGDVVAIARRLYIVILASCCRDRTLEMPSGEILS